MKLLVGRFACLGLGIEDGPELARAGGGGEFLGFARGNQAVAKGLAQRVKGRGDRGGREHHFAHLMPAAEGRPPVRRVSESRLVGATPTNALISRSFKPPGSSVLMRTTPAVTPFLQIKGAQI